MFPFPRMRRTKAASYQPSVLVLEDRTVPSGFRPYLPVPAPGPATHLEVYVPRNVTADQSFSVEVEAVSASDRLATGFLDTIHFTIQNADGGATIPVDYQFTAADHGIHWFTFTLTATGSQAITATDTTTSSINGIGSTYVNPAPAATHFAVLMPSYVTEGVPVTVTVIALTQYNRVASGYTGTADFTSSLAATLPSDHPFVASDDGQTTFQVTFNATGAATLTATDATTASITGQKSLTVEAVGSVTHFGVYTLGPAIPGAATSVVVVALDANNHVVAGYTGTVTLTDTDTASLPAAYTFLASDDGAHVFSVTFDTVGKQTLTATAGAITGAANVDVVQKFHFGWGWWW